MIDTISAISTAVGEGGIGIVRLSGRDSISIANKVFKSIDGEDLKNKENRKLHYGHIYDNDKLIDEVLIAVMKGPKTYTREDMVEIYCHGGIVPVKKILELSLKEGARLAEPGEFTKRAFLNGRLDLSQAEAVMDLIQAKTDKSYDVSLKHLEGNLSKKIEELRERLLGVLANIEASISFPEDDLENLDYSWLGEDLNYVRDEIEKLLSSSDRGKILKDGINTVILGRPNVGKSSLLNAILRENRAIVTDIPGTTRDIIEEYVNIDGIPMKIVDTAGIRSTDDLVERIGVDRAKEMVEDADLIIGVFDLSEDLTEDDEKILDILKNKKSIVFLNKLDQGAKWSKEDLDQEIRDKKIIEGSIIDNKGLGEIEEEIKDMFYGGDLKIENDIIVNNIRHKNQLIKAKNDLEEALQGFDMGMPLDCLEVDIKSSWENLGEISGETVTEDILDKIFSDFCIGK